MKNQRPLNGRCCWFFIINEKILSSYIIELIQHINSANHVIHSLYNIIKTIVNLGDNKGFINDYYSQKLMYLQDTLLMIIVENPGKDISHSKKYHYK